MMCMLVIRGRNDRPSLCMKVSKLDVIQWISFPFYFSIFRKFLKG